MTQQEILTLLQSDEAREKVKQSIGRTLIPDGIWNIEEGRKLERLATAALNALVKMIKAE